jgi:bifunctional ADP-heptose synthase (sugar kinase/adenylyltransferase)
MRAGPLVVVGDALLDRDVTGRADRLSPDAPVPVVSAITESERPGGAALAALLAALDRPAGGVVLVTALGADRAGERVAELLSAAGVPVLAARLPGRTPVKERVRVRGQSLLRLDREDGTVRPVDGTPAMREAVAAAGAVLVSDYGRGLLAGAHLRGWLADATRRGPVVWDTWLRPVRSVIEEPWWGFGGAWGAGGGLKGQIGPLGPSPWKQSSDPDPDSAVLGGSEPVPSGAISQ